MIPWSVAPVYTYDPAILKQIKDLKPDYVLVAWGVAVGGNISACTSAGYANATEYAQEASVYTSTTFIGANGIGPRIFGEMFGNQLSLYCGLSGITSNKGDVLMIAPNDVEDIYLYTFPAAPISTHAPPAGHRTSHGHPHPPQARSRPNIHPHILSHAGTHHPHFRSHTEDQTAPRESAKAAKEDLWEV